MNYKISDILTLLTQRTYNILTIQMTSNPHTIQIQHMNSISTRKQHQISDNNKNKKTEENGTTTATTTPATHSTIITNNNNSSNDDKNKEKGSKNSKTEELFAKLDLLAQEEKIQQRKDEAVAKREEGNQWYKDQKFGMAIQCYTDAMELNPDDVTNVSNRSNAFLLEDFMRKVSVMLEYALKWIKRLQKDIID